MQTDQRCPQHPDKFLGLVCDELVCSQCQEDFWEANPVPPPKRVCVPVWDQHHGKWDLSNSVPVK